jgi:polygalacturonase
MYSFTRVSLIFLGAIALQLTPGFAAPSAEMQAKQSGSDPFHLLVAPQTLRSDAVTLLWDKLEAGGDATYEVLRDDEIVGTTQKTHFTVNRLEPQHRYVFTIRARNTGANVLTSYPLHVQTPAREAIVSVVDHGAVGDGKTLNTKAIQAAIEQCPPGGVVRIPKGVFVSGALFLKSDMTLEIAAGGVLKGSVSTADYEPFIPSRFEGWELQTYASLINAGTLDHAGPANVHNISIRGEGTISGGGSALGEAMTAAHGLRSRGRLICLTNAANVELQGVSLVETPCWTLHYIYSENVTCHDLTLRSTVRNGDGIDPDSSKNSYIFNCSFDTGDDCIAIKSGKNPEGNVINRPTENVRITDCRFTRGHGISIGSEISGGVRNIVVDDCVAGKLLHGFQIKATPERGNIVENVTVRDCDLQMISILTALPYNNDGAAAPTPPYFRNFRFFNLDLSAANPAKPVIIVNGFAADGHRTKNVSFENIKLPPGAIVKLDQTENVVFKQVSTTDNQKPAYQISRSEHVSY